MPMPVEESNLMVDYGFRVGVPILGSDLFVFRCGEEITGSPLDLGDVVLPLI
jgi:hypothetical protein